MITDICNNLIWYKYKDDEIAWDGEHYISILAEGAFSSLEELDAFWDSYNEAQYERQEVIITREMAMDAGDPSLEGEVWKW